MSAQPATHRPEAAASPPMIFAIGAIVLAVALAGTGLAYSIDYLSRRTAGAPAEDNGGYTIMIAGSDLTVPAAWLRFADQRRSGFAEELNLALDLDFGNGNEANVELDLLPASYAQPSESLIDQVYLHKFGMAQTGGVPGLVGKPLQGADGYAGETVWYDPLSAHPFVAKCLEPVEENLPARCLRTIRLTPRLAAVYAFDEDVLINWREFDAAMAPKLERLGLVSGS